MLTDYYKLFKVYRRTGGDFSAVSWELVGTYAGFIQPAGGGESIRTGKGGEAVSYVLYTGLYTQCHYGYKVEFSGQSFIMLYTIQVNGISGVGSHKEIAMGAFE